ncbi:ABC transporter ATP-binding protein/permease [Paenibacillus sp. CC-CFT747]|nr:ABC transporter ATP-binding protein/permease [Paenibacillus sp. CC-CFT747]
MNIKFYFSNCFRKLLGKKSVKEAYLVYKWAFTFLFREYPYNTSFIIFLYVAQGLLPALGIFILNNLIDVILATSRFREAIPWLLALLFSSMLSGSVLMRLAKPLNTRLQQKVEYTLTSRHLQKTSELPFVFFENSMLYDQIHRSTTPGKKLHLFFHETLGLLQSLTTVGSIALLFSELSIWLSALLPAVVIPYSIQSLKANDLWEELIYGQTEEKRRAAYMESLLTGRAEQKELRIYQLPSPLSTVWRQLLQKLRDQTLNQRRALEKSIIPLQLSDFTLHLVVAGYLVIALVNHRITVGSFDSLFTAIKSLNDSSAIISSGFRQTLEALVGVKYVKQFLSLPTIGELRGTEKFPAITKGVQVKDVSFQYPVSEEPILHNISMRIRPRECLAIVGENGAGKSTLMKLLLRLYQPTTGNIEVDGVNYEDLEEADFRKKVKAAFQDFYSFEFTLAQSIGIGDITSFDQEHFLEPDREKIVRAATLAGGGHLIDSLPKGVNTPIGHVLEGAIGLSGGQWQRIALSRALMGDPELLILDEPTSALDPRAEAQLYSDFKEIMMNKTVVIVTHRLGSAKFADRIVVMKKGRIAEEGHHDALIHAGGEYARMWKEQSQWYL